MEKFYGRVVIGDILCIKKSCGGCTYVVIEMMENIRKEVMTRMSKFRK
jgi:hypothetical protein